MGEVTPIDRYRVPKVEYVFECACGGQQFYLHQHGAIECRDCQQIIEKLEWVYRTSDNAA